MHAARIRTPNRTLILLCFDELVRVFSMSVREFGAQSILNLACKLLMHLRTFSGAPGREQFWSEGIDRQRIFLRRSKSTQLSTQIFCGKPWSAMWRYVRARSFAISARRSAVLIERNGATRGLMSAFPPTAA